MTAPYYVDHNGKTRAYKTLAGAERAAERLQAIVFRPHDVGEYCQCEYCQDDTCPTCWGVGELMAMAPCPTCHGTGAAPRPQEDTAHA